MLGYVTPMDKLEGLDRQIGARLDRKLQEAGERKITNRQSADSLDGTTILYEDGNKPVKRKRALRERNSPGIAGRVCDEWLREAEGDLCLVILPCIPSIPDAREKQILRSWFPNSTSRLFQFTLNQQTARW